MGIRGLGQSSALLAALAVGGAQLALAHDPLSRKIDFDIPEQSADSALLHFAEQAGIPLTIPGGQFTHGANRLVGRFTVDDGLQRLLEGTRISASIDDYGQIIVRMADNMDTEEGSDMSEDTNRRRSMLASAIAALFAGGGTGIAGAQQPEDPAAAPAGVLEEIQVTGSRIERTGMITPVPVTSMSSEELHYMDPGNLIESLQQLPQFLASSTAQQRGTFLGPAGQSFLNIRGMGQNRTLVLLDGRRIVPGDRLSSVDINLFPEAMIQRVEVVTGGASAAYGADAVAGVANFILNREYTGFEGRVQGGMTQFSDGENWSAMFAGGFPVGDRAHVIMSAESYNMREVQGQIAGLDRRGTGRVEDGGWFHRWGWVTNPDWQAAVNAGECQVGTLCPAGPQRLTVPEVHSTQFSVGGLINQPGFSYDRHTFLADGESTREFILSPISALGGTLSQSGGPEYWNAHLGQRHELTARNKRRNGFASINYDLTDNTTVFLQGILGRMESHWPNRQGGQGPSHMGNLHITIYQDNAFLPENIRQAMIDEGLESFRMDKGGWITGRSNYGDQYRDGTVTTQMSLTTGLQTALANGWNLDLHYQYGESKQTMILENMPRIDRMFLAMDSVVDPETGGVVCNVQRYNPTLEELAAAVEGVEVPSPTGPRSIHSPVGLDNTIEHCVPFNVFGHGNVSPEAAAYVVGGNKHGISRVRQHFTEVLLTGDVHEGIGAGSIGMAAGATFREESLNQVVHPQEIDLLGPAMNAPHLGIRGIPPGFAGGAPNLHAFSTITTFSGSFNVWELFSELAIPLYDAPGGGQRVELNLAGRYADYSRAGGVWTWKGGLDLQVTDDLRLRGTYSRDAREGTFAELFDRQGGGAFVNDPAFAGEQWYTSVGQGGNPNLGVEEAETMTFGFVYQPGWLDGLQLSTDYYDVDLEGAIGQLGAQRIVDECYAGVTQLCAQMARDPDTNRVTRVENTYLNIDRARVRGVDIEMIYRAQPNLLANWSETLTFRALAGYLRENSTTPLDGEPLNQAGAGSTPDWTTVASLNYSFGPWRAFAQHRWVNSLTRMANWTEGVEVDHNRVASATYVNTRLSYTHDTPRGSWEFYGNVSNLFDRTPPMYANAVGRGIAGATGVPGLHDQLGRRFAVGAHFRY